MFRLILIVFVFAITACSKTVINSNLNNRYKFSFKTISSDYEKNSTYTVLLPKEGKKEKHYPHNDEIYTEFLVKYKDNSIFYISNDIWNISNVNARNLMDVGINGYSKKAILDTISYNGIQKDGKFWKEITLGEIIIGFSNVPEERKFAFDKAINSIVKR